MAVEALGLTKTYRGGVRAVAGMTFAVEPGRVFCLVGPNGAGKSTTVRILTTLTRPDAGRAEVAGSDVVKEADRVRRSIGVVGQRSGVDPDATGRENLTLQAHLHDLDGRTLKSRVAQLLGRFGLVDAADRAARTYSGGMQRRLDIALGLVHRPRVLFLDEPTTGLDPKVRAVMWDEIARLAHEDGLTIVLTTHYLEEADRLAHTVAIVDHGSIVVQGAPAELKAELRGDSLHVELREPSADGRAPTALSRVPGVRDVTVDGALLRARADDGAATLPVALATLQAARIRVAAATVARPSLDDVYLRYAGRAFDRADQREAGR